MGADYSYPLTSGWTISPGQIVDLHLALTAPSAPGSYQGYWVFRNPNGVLFGWGTDGDLPLWVDIQVGVPTATPTPTSTIPATETTTPSPSPTPTETPPVSTPVPGLFMSGHVRLQDGSGVQGVAICRSYAAYPGVVVATTDAYGYYQADFAPIPGDETVHVWASAAGFTFQPSTVDWRHYHGYEDRSLDFLASPASATAVPPGPCS